MISYELKKRVRYGETDQMGFLYYGHYAFYYEIARVEMMRNIGLVYKDMEKMGVMMPVLELKTKYIKPAYYDDEVTIKIVVKELPTTRIRFEYELFNPAGELINIGETTLVFVNAKTFKPCYPPEEMYNLLKRYFN